jgi:hypothetical protein
MTNNEINEFVKTNLPIKHNEKDKYGEVFTNPILINKMLDLYPKESWTNPKLTWLDPSVGAGFFMIFVYVRLFHGLQKWEPNEKKRSTHIIENMLYMVELNKTNCDICKDMFGNKINIICGDFLQKHKYDDLLFDCIVGNPPYQDDHGLSKTGKRINGGKNKLYERIFLKSISILKPGGHLSFVVPDNIFSGNGSASYQILIQNDIPFVSFNPTIQTYFHKIQQPVCYFLLKKRDTPSNGGLTTINGCLTTINGCLTTIECNDKLTFKLQLQNRPVNPIRNWSPYTEKLINKFVSSERNAVKYNRGKSMQSYKGNKYSLIYTTSKSLYTNNTELAPGLGIKKAVLFSISPDLAFKMDYSGKYGVGPNTFYIPFDTNAQGHNLEKFLNSDEYKTLANATKTTRQYLKIAFIEHLNLTTIFNLTRIFNLTTKTKTKTKTKHKRPINKTRKRK